MVRMGRLKPVQDSFSFPFYAHPLALTPVTVQEANNNTNSEMRANVISILGIISFIMLSRYTSSMD